MKKALDQTIRDLKREVNKKVLKVPSIEQKVLDATSNEPWGPHGSLLADIAQASRNYHEYQMIMTIMWKRINSTGKNWRHVYKALTVMEYMVANGSERVIDEIREHAYQISTLSSFQYIDSSGRDQGLNVRRKSQSLVSLVNDKEKIQEAREKAAANKEKFRSASMGGTHEPGSYSGAGYGDRYDDERYAGRYGSRDDERNGYGREGEWSNRDEDKYGRDADRYSRDSEERYGRGNYRDDDHRGRYADESGSRSSDRDKDRAYDDEHHSSRGSSVKAEDHPQEGRPLERKFSEQNIGAPPSYEDAIGGSKSPVYSERDGETPAVPAPPVPKPTSPTTNTTPGQTTADPSSSWSDPSNKAEAFDEFDPRGSVAAVSGTSNNAEVDLIGSLSDSWAITPVSSATFSTDANASGTFAESQFMTTSSPPTMNQSFEDPFGDSPFKALSSSDDVTTQGQNFASVSSFQPSAVNSVEQTQQVAQMNNNFEVQETFSNLSFSTPDASGFQLPPNAQSVQQEPFSLQNDDILAGILPPSGPPPPAASHTPFTPPVYQPTMPLYNAPNFVQQSGPPPAGSFPIAAQNQMMPTSQNSNMNFLSHSTPAPSTAANTAPQMPVTVTQQTNNLLGDLLPHAGSTIAQPSQPTSTMTTGSLALVSQPAPKQKFEMKSAVWADTLSRGLVDLNISGPKVNPNADIGVDFVSLNRKEKRMEKPTAAPVASTINMGKAMGSGSGMGRSGSGMIRPQSNPMIGSGMGMGMGGASGGSMGMGGMGMGGAPGVGMGMGMGMGGAPGVGMGGYGMMNQRPNMGMGMGMGGNMGMGTGQGVPMMNQHAASNMPGVYNPMMARGGYPPQQPYGSGYQ